jgi:dipeptidase E
MKKLFLTSSFVDVAEFLEPFIGEKLKNKTITFIPTASIPEEYKGYVDNDKRAFENLGLIVDVLDVSTNSPENIETTIKKNDMIYVSGGNTFFLLNEFVKTGTDTIIIEEIKKGKPYIGASAGSVIASPNIQYVEKMDDKTKAENLTDYKALNLIDFYPLPHHTNEPFKNAVEEIITDLKDKIKFVPISNTEAIEVTGEIFRIVGNK